MNQTFKDKAPELVKNLMRDFGLKDFQACGILGNLGRESDGFTELREIGQPAGRGGYGWGQWTGARAHLFLNWCHSQGFDWRSDAGNYGYLKHELQNGYAFVLAHLRATANLVQATQAFERYYEAAGVPAMADRIAWAQGASAAYHAALAA